MPIIKQPKHEQLFLKDGQFKRYRGWGARERKDETRGTLWRSPAPFPAAHHLGTLNMLTQISKGHNLQGLILIGAGCGLTEYILKEKNLLPAP